MVFRAVILQDYCGGKKKKSESVDFETFLTSKAMF